MNESGVEFEGDKYRSRIILGPPQTPKVIDWVMRGSGGLIQSERQAGYVLMAIVCGMVLLAVIFLFIAFAGPRRPAGERIYANPLTPPTSTR